MLGSPHLPFLGGAELTVLRHARKSVENEDEVRMIEVTIEEDGIDKKAFSAEKDYMSVLLAGGARCHNSRLRNH